MKNIFFFMVASLGILCLETSEMRASEPTNLADEPSSAISIDQLRVLDSVVLESEFLPIMKSIFSFCDALDFCSDHLFPERTSTFHPRAGDDSSPFDGADFNGDGVFNMDDIRDAIQAQLDQAFNSGQLNQFLYNKATNALKNFSGIFGGGLTSVGTMFNEAMKASKELEKLVDAYDTDGDGSLSEDEFNAMAEEIEDAFDANGDGELTMEDFDTNGDGIVTEEEFDEAVEEAARKLGDPKGRHLKKLIKHLKKILKERDLSIEDLFKQIRR